MIINEIPNEVAADKNGFPTSDPSNVNSLIPIGGYKGFGLAAMGEVLCGILTGMNFGKSIPKMFDSSMSTPRQLGQFYIVFRVDATIDQNQFEHRMKTMSYEVRSLKSRDAKKKVQMPNDPEIAKSFERRKNGMLNFNFYSEVSGIRKRLDKEFASRLGHVMRRKVCLPTLPFP